MIGSAESVITKSGVKHEDLNLDNTIQLNQFIEQALKEATHIVKSYTRRDFELHNETEILDGSNRSTLMLKGAPIVNIDQILINDNTLKTEEYRIKRSEMIGENSGVIEHRGIWPPGWNNIKVEYSWGYEQPPNDIVSVVEGIATDLVLKALKDYKQSGADSLTMDGFTATFNPKPLINDDRREIMNKYSIIPTG